MSGPDCLRLPPRATSAGRARQWVHSWCRGRHLDPHDETAVVLVGSELVTNAVEHAHSELTIHLEADASSVTVVVADGHAKPPVPLPVDTEALEGRGLLIVDGLASAWGVAQRDGGGKTVWATLPRRR